ncbi:MAG: alpha/beta fold hydrolase [Cytophagales bacterium]|nr:MAG: alpha/beta fold hydrolase [Cytophagales bacterium]
MKIRSLCLFFTILLSVYNLHAQNPLQFASLGNFKLVSGESIEDCKIAYRAYGTLNAEKSNVILAPTWFSGTSEQLKNSLRMMIDSTRFYVILVDALGNGVSSSPTNSKKQKGKKFPKFTIEDMVNSQYKMLTEKLQINHLYAVIGTSMGGMQTLQWTVSYPNFMDKAISIVGTPKQSFNDLLLWKSELQPIEDAENAKEEKEAMRTVALVHALNLLSSSYRNAQTVDFQTFTDKEMANMSKLNPLNWASQLRAMMAHDIYKIVPKGQIKEKLKAKMLLVYSLQDMMVNPQASIELADLLQNERLELKGNCGHLAPSCEGAEVLKAVKEFLQR